MSCSRAAAAAVKVPQGSSLSQQPSSDSSSSSSAVVKTAEKPRKKRRDRLACFFLPLRPLRDAQLDPPLLGMRQGRRQRSLGRCKEGRGIPYNFEIVTPFHSIRKIYTKLEVFVDKTVRGRARTQRGNTRGGTTKKREISRTLLSINLHFLEYM